jgi:hypothetical protein
MLFVHSRVAVSVALIVLLVGTGAGTVAAAGSAKPGDTLFPVAVAVENAQIALASSQDKSKLRVRFAEKRIAQITEILDTAAREQSASEESSKAASGEKETPPQEEEPQPTLMMAAKINTAFDATGTLETQDASAEEKTSTEPAVSIEEQASAQEEETLSPDTAARVAAGLQNAVALLADASNDSTNTGDTEAGTSVKTAIDKLNQKLSAAPGVGGHVRLVQDKEGRIGVAVDGATDETAENSVEVQRGRVRTKVQIDARGAFQIESRKDEDTNDTQDDNKESFGESDEQESVATSSGVFSATTTEKLDESFSATTSDSTMEDDKSHGDDSHTEDDSEAGGGINLDGGLYLPHGVRLPPLHD